MSNIVVLGSANIDYISHVIDFPKPGETVSSSEYRIENGGKGANQAVAVARLGSSVDFITCVGDDHAGKAMIDAWKNDGISVPYDAIIENQISGSAQVTVSSFGENNIIISAGANQFLNDDVVKNNQDKLLFADYLLLQLETPIRSSILAAKIAKESGAKIVLNPAPAKLVPHELLRYVDIITPNETEASSLSGVHVSDEQSAINAADVIHLLGIKCVIITLGSKGALVSELNKTPVLVPTRKVHVVDTVAAGDTFNGAVLVALSEGKELIEAVKFAHSAAALAVMREGAQRSVPTREELNQYLLKTIK